MPSKDQRPNRQQGAQWVLASRCARCGGVKSRPSLTAYVYCDYCGSLADYDFRKACEAPTQLPGPVYEALLARLNKPLEKALASGDRDAYQSLQERLFDAWVTACPLSCPPRVAQADYRKGYIAFLAAAATAATFDAANTALQAAVTQAVGRLQWAQTAAGPRVSDPSFRPVLDAVIAQQQHLNSAAFIHALPAHPDRVDAATRQRMAMSLMLQGWLPYLGEQTRAWAVERCGLAQQYIEAAPVDQATGCAQCGAALPKLDGARCAVCEHCGIEVAYTHALCCDGCGKHLTLARRIPHADHDVLNCPYCRRRLSLQGMVWPEVVLTDYTVAG